MKKLIILFVILLFSSSALAWNTSMFGGSGKTYTCTLRASHDSNEDSSQAIARYNNAERVGIVWTPTTQCKVCRVDVYITNVGGDPSLYDYYVEAWTLTGTPYALSALCTNGRSSKQDGAAAWNNTWVSFTYSSYPILAASTAYSIHWKMVASDGDPTGAAVYDEDNFVAMAEDADGGASVYDPYVWQADGDYQSNDDNDDPYIKIYCYE